MSRRGAERVEFEYILGGIVPILCKCEFRGGAVQSVSPFFNGESFQYHGIIIDVDGEDFTPMGEVLCRWAQSSYDESKGK